MLERLIRGAPSLLLTGVLATTLAACGSSGTSNHVAGSGTAALIDTSGIQNPTTEPLGAGKRGGTLQVLDETDFEHLDPGMAYYTFDYEVVLATQRPLYSQKPNSTEPTPDMASAPPVISSDGRTVTVHLRRGVRFSPPVNREVTSDDVAYAFERGANPNVANPYFHTYFDAIEGAPRADGGAIKGIATPDPHTIVFHLTEPKGQIVANALVLPLSAAVPRDYANRFDRHSPSDYANYQVATGPYMLANDSAGKVLGTGYTPGKSATLVRNPNWNPTSDYRPAYLNRIEIKIGGTQAIIGRQVLEGTNVVENEPPAQSIVKLAYEDHKDQLQISPGASSRYIALDNKVGAFSNIDLRKALWAALDRTAMDKARGGKLVTKVATHFLYPTINGFQEAGGMSGPKVDYNEHPEGNMAIAERYMRLAGYPSGKYTGGKTVQIVGAKGGPTEQDAEIVNQTLEDLGFKTKFTLVESATMFEKYCNVPKEEIDVCPNVSWLADFADPQTVLDPTFNGKFINATSNVNWSQTDVPKINQAMAAAELLTGAESRARAWAKIDEALVLDATAIPYDWEKQASIEGHGVRGVGDLWDVGEWDYAYTSLK